TLAAGCGGDGSGDGNRGLDVGTDAAPLTDGYGEQDTASPAADTAATPDVAPAPDVPIEPGGFGAPCQGNGDCDSGWCVEGAEGYLCTKQCVEECPGGYDCKAVQSGGADVAFL